MATLLYLNSKCMNVFVQSLLIAEEIDAALFDGGLGPCQNV